MAGVALNTDPFLIEDAEDNKAQLYGQLMINVLFGDRLAIGIVPTYLRKRTPTTAAPSESSWRRGATSSKLSSRIRQG